MAVTRIERILILAKTYPSPSAQHVETSCVAGITEHGKMIRLYPVPFRLIDGANQFKKWQWVKLRVEKASKDHRPESHKIYINEIACGDIITTNREWAERYKWLEKCPTFTNFDEMEQCRINEKLSLAILKPKFVSQLIIEKARNPDWTEEEKAKLTYEHKQGELFSDEEIKIQIKELRKIPYDFYYKYTCDSPCGEREFKHKIVDWEVGALYWNCKKSHKDNWEKPFREKLEAELIKKNLMFLMGNIHRFADQWLIISLIYPPKQTPVVESLQQSLF